MVNLGDEVKDKVTGFRGIAVTRHMFIAGCDRITVQPPVDKEKKMPDAQTFDEPMLEIIKRAKVDSAPRNVGGPDKWMPKAKPTATR